MDDRCFKKIKGLGVTYDYDSGIGACKNFAAGPSFPEATLLSLHSAEEYEFVKGMRWALMVRIWSYQIRQTRQTTAAATSLNESMMY